MLEAEAALAAAQADEGVISREAAEAVAAACRRSYELGGREAANPVVPLARALKEAAPEAHTWRDEPGHPRHGGDARRAAGARADPRRARRRRRRVRAPRARAPRDGDGGAHADAAGAADHLRPQGRGLAERRGGGARRPARGRARGAARRPGRHRSRRSSPRASPSGSSWPRRRCRGTATARAWPGSAPRWRSPPARARRWRSTSCCSPRTRSARSSESSEGGRGGSSAMAHKQQPGRRDPRAGRGAIGARRRGRPARGDGRRARARGRARGRASGARCRAALAGTGGAAWSLREALEGLTVHLSAWRRTSKASPVSSTRPRSTP